MYWITPELMQQTAWMQMNQLLNNEPQANELETDHNFRQTSKNPLGLFINSLFLVVDSELGSKLDYSMCCNIFSVCLTRIVSFITKREFGWRLFSTLYPIQFMIALLHSYFWISSPGHLVTAKAKSVWRVRSHLISVESVFAVNRYGILCLKEWSSEFENCTNGLREQRFRRKN